MFAEQAGFSIANRIKEDQRGTNTLVRISMLDLFSNVFSSSCRLIVRGDEGQQGWHQGQTG